ncbi:unnamed protein product [Musa acuminata subsp. burmannicoides]
MLWICSASSEEGLHEMSCLFPAFGSEREREREGGGNHSND